MRISFPAGFILHLSVNIYTGCPKTSGLYLFLDYVSTVTARSFMKQKIGPQSLNILRKIAWTSSQNAQGRLWYTSVSREFLKPCNFFHFNLNALRSNFAENGHEPSKVLRKFWFRNSNRLLFRASSWNGSREKCSDGLAWNTLYIYLNIHSVSAERIVGM